MTWLVIGIALALATGAFAVPGVLLFKPWRIRRLACWLYGRSSLYRRWHLRWFFVRPIRKSAAAMRGLALAAERASAATERFAQVWQRVSARADA